MKKLIISMVMMAVISAGCSNEQDAMKKFKEFFVEKEAVAPPSYNIVFILDGTGSAQETYAVPKVDMAYLDKLVQYIEQTGNGRLWISYIDAQSYDNEVSYLNIRANENMKSLKDNYGVDDAGLPIRKAGELPYNYKKRKQEWIEAYPKFQKDSTNLMNEYHEKRKNWSSKTKEIINTAYSKIKKGGDCSDVIGATCNGIRILLSIEKSPNTMNFIVLVSDAVDNVGKKMDFKTIPSDIKILVVNNSGSGSKNCLLEICTEVDNLERMEEIIFKK